MLTNRIMWTTARGFTASSAWALVASLLVLGPPVSAQANATAASKNALSADFAGENIPRGKDIWFVSLIKASGVNAAPATIYFRNSRIQFTANGIRHRIAGPNARVTFSPSANVARTTFDKTRNEYQTVVPASFSANVFAAGIFFRLPDDVGLKYRTGQATWEADFYSDTPGVTLVWQWRATAYRGLVGEYSQTPLRPADVAGNCWLLDRAGELTNWWNGSSCKSPGMHDWFYEPVARSNSASVVPIAGIPPEPPFANAWQRQFVPEGAVVRLDGTHSRSSTGKTLSYQWSFVSTPDGKTPSPPGAETATPTFVPDKDGTYTLQLIVSDGTAHSSPSRVRINSEAVPLGKWTFSMPDSVLLFFNPYHDLRLVAPGHSEILRPWGGTRPSLSRNGDLVAWGYEVQDESLRVVAPELSFNSSEYLDTPIRNVLALYFVRERKVVTYPVGRPSIRYGGPDDGVADAAISPDSSKVAFTGCPTDCSKLSGIFLLDVVTGQMQPLVPNFKKGLETIRVIHPSWSPDGSRIVFEQNENLAVIDLQSNEIHTIGKGQSPVWSPDGEWIAYMDQTREKCFLVRPDGTGEKALMSLSGGWRQFFTSRYLFYDAAVWSPDGKKLLLTIIAGEVENEVILFDIATGKTKRMRKHGSVAAGWAKWRGN